MKVKELIEILQKVNPDYDVILSQDEEGNAYFPVRDCTEAMYLSEADGVVFPPFDEDGEYDVAVEDYETNSLIFWP